MHAQILGVSALLSLATLTQGRFHNPQQHVQKRNESSIQWTECEIPQATLPMECGTLMVPLDYTNDMSNDTVQLELVRLKSSNCSPKGSILLNFGGPGADGRADFGLFGPRMQAATGGAFDLINVVPRGTDGELLFSCYPDTASRVFGIQALAGNASEVANGHIWARSTVYAENCGAVQNETGSYIGTAFVARDLMQVVDALGEDGMLRYWGVSYGSLLGATTVAMFPDRVDKVILDGVVNPFEYYQNTEVELMTSVDDVFRGFCQACVSARDECPLAGDLSAEQLEEMLYDYFETLRFNPVPLLSQNFPGGGLPVDYSIIKGSILALLNFPSAWPLIANGIAATIAGSPPLEIAGEVPPQDALSGIKCSDVLTRLDNYTDWSPQAEARLGLSRFAGDLAWEVAYRCGQWKLPAKERYDGDFRVRTKNPVLLIGNTFDPVTPLVSARNVSETLEGSVLLQQDSYGHDSLAIGSLCTAKAVRSYFVNGTLPDPGTICDVQVPLYSADDGWTDVIEQLNAL